MNIEKDSVVTMHYTLTDDNGTQIDSSVGSEPLAYIHGHAHIIPGLENALAGKAKGDKLTVKVAPEDGYGTRNDALVQKLPKAQFETTDAIEKGMKFQANTPDGQLIILTVVEVDTENVTVDGNHELAGVTLNFDVEITDVRAATQEELDHGHVHGPGGHDH